MRCYYSAKAAGKGYRKCLKNLWDSRNSDKAFRTCSNLSCQARAELKSNLLSELELREAQQCMLTINTGLSVTGEDPELSPSVQVNEVIDSHQSDHIITPNRGVPARLDSAYNLLQPNILEDGIHDFDAILSCVKSCTHSENVTDELKSVFDQLCFCLSLTGSLDVRVRDALPRITKTKSVKHWIMLVNECLHRCFEKQRFDLPQCDCLVYASSLTVIHLAGLRRGPPRAGGKKNAWRSRLEEKIQMLRRHLSQLMSI